MALSQQEARTNSLLAQLQVSLRHLDRVEIKPQDKKDRPKCCNRARLWPQSRKVTFAVTVTPVRSPAWAWGQIVTQSIPEHTALYLICSSAQPSHRADGTQCLGTPPAALQHCVNAGVAPNLSGNAAGGWQLPSVYSQLQLLLGTCDKACCIFRNSL